MAKTKKTTKQESQETNTLAAPNAKESTVKKVLSVSVEVDKPAEAPQPKQEVKTIKLKPGQVLYVRITETGEEVEPQVVNRSTWDKYLSKNPNFKLKKNTV